MTIVAMTGKSTICSCGHGRGEHSGCLVGWGPGSIQSGTGCPCSYFDGTQTGDTHMESIVLERIHDLLVYRRWYRQNRWASWSDLRKENEVELRALVRLARQHRKEFIDHPPTATPESELRYAWGDR